MAGQTSDYKDIRLCSNLKKNVALIKDIFKNEATVRNREIEAVGKEKTKCSVFYMDGMVNVELINESIIKPLVLLGDVKATADDIANKVLFASEAAVVESVADMLRAIMYGDTLLLIDGENKAITINTKGWRTRGINEPEDEKVLRGPREGFDEAALLNLAMIRRRLLTPDLCTELIRVGRRSDTIVFICYLGTLVNKKTLDLLKKRLKNIDIDGILDSNYITEQIKDNKSSLFNTNGTTERPDTVAARLLEGRIALIVDGTPVAVTLPYLFSENFQADEDYYLSYTVSSIGRLLRYICFFLSISIPAIFIAATTYHKELLPTSMALSVTQLRAGVPFSAVTECILLIFIFEILKETGVRMPKSLGHALSIVGGLVVGQAAVEARIISAPMLIVVALAGISGLIVPRLTGAVFYIRIILVLLSAAFGLYGYISGFVFMLIYILNLESFGVSYTVSLRRATAQSLKDTIIRVPWTKMLTRPDFNKNIIRKGKEPK